MSSFLRRVVRAAIITGAIIFPPGARAQGEPVERARAAFEARRYAEVRTTLEPVLRVDPKNAPAQYWLGRALLAEARWDDAVKAFERAVALDDSRALYHLWLGNAIGQQAQRASKFRQPFLARRVQHEFERAVQLDPADLDAREGLADFYSIAPGVMGGSAEKAQAQLRVIAAADPLRGHLLGARLAMRRRDDAAAERALRAAMTQFPDTAAGYVSLAGWYASKGQLPRAFETMEALLARKPDDMSARYAFARLAATNGQQLDRAERYLREYLAYTPGPGEPSHAGAHYRLGMVQEKRGRIEEAKREYETAVRMDASLQPAADALKRLREGRT